MPYKERITEEDNATATRIENLATDVVKLLSENNCTYNEAEVILDYVSKFLHKERTGYEYNNLRDYLLNKKEHLADNVVIPEIGFWVLKEQCQ